MERSQPPPASLLRILGPQIVPDIAGHPPAHKGHRARQRIKGLPPQWAFLLRLPPSARVKALLSACFSHLLPPHHKQHKKLFSPPPPPRLNQPQKGSLRMKSWYRLIPHSKARGPNNMSRGAYLVRLGSHPRLRYSPGSKWGVCVLPMAINPHRAALSDGKTQWDGRAAFLRMLIYRCQWG